MPSSIMMHILLEAGRFRSSLTRRHNPINVASEQCFIVGLNITCGSISSKLILSDHRTLGKSFYTEILGLGSLDTNRLMQESLFTGILLPLCIHHLQGL